MYQYIAASLPDSLRRCYVYRGIYHIYNWREQTHPNYLHITQEAEQEMINDVTLIERDHGYLIMQAYAGGNEVIWGAARSLELAVLRALLSLEAHSAQGAGERWSRSVSRCIMWCFNDGDAVPPRHFDSEMLDKTQERPSLRETWVAELREGDYRHTSTEREALSLLFPQALSQITNLSI